MRWNNLTIAAEERARLPGYKDDAVVRHFEAPGSIPTRFYEVRAKSILNRVPEASQVPFRWTINPYRGCTHACTYCLWGGTPVLLADGRHKSIELLEVGEEIYGTQIEGKHRKYVRTVVLDKWITIKPAIRVVLADGTELITSGDHRFLSDRGWKHVINSARSVPDRPHLTLRSRLLGTGRFAELPIENSEYRRGYLSGIVRGDGHLTDMEALRRVRDYLQAEQITGSEWVFERAVGSRRQMLAVGAHRQMLAVGAHRQMLAVGAHRQTLAVGSRSPGLVEEVTDLVGWPPRVTGDWCRGFLAGIFDAEGNRSAFGLRIANKDPEILAWIERCARSLGFEAGHDHTADDNGLACVRIRGGLAEHLRFFHLTDPAITRKRTIEGQMVKTSTNLKVEAIEPLGRALPLYDITTGTGDFIADGVVSHNCFARPTHKYLDFDAGRDFEREIVVKVNAPERLRVELARPSWKGEHVALGTNTDPYQWAEGRYKLMPGIWRAMRDFSNPCSVLTKSPLLLRDLELMKEIAARTEFSAALSVPTLEEKAWRATEPHTPHPRARLEAVAELTRAGIRTGVLVAPLIPGVNDSPDQVERILELATEAGASYITGIALHLRGDVRKLWFAWLREHRPDLIGRYEELYRRGAYAPPHERRRLAELVKGPDLPPGERMRGRLGDELKRGEGRRAQSFGHAAARAEVRAEATDHESDGERGAAQGILF